MKTTLASMLAVLLSAAVQLNAQSKVTVEATSRDISYYLDLKAVASVFADAENLEDFEMRLNDYNSEISNLDLNNDNVIDYLRVVEANENNTHLVVIQAVLGTNYYQDVATVFVEREKANKVSVRIIGEPYIYGANYIIEPVYYRPPVILTWLWTPRYVRWHSPYYWGYYPSYYHSRPLIAINIYMRSVHRHINRHHHYAYSSYRPSRSYNRMYKSVSRNDYGSRYPDRAFSKRNSNVASRRDFEVRDREASRTARVNAVNRSSRSNVSTGGSRTGVSSRTRTENSRTNTSDRTKSSVSTTRESTSSTRPAANSTVRKSQETGTSRSRSVSAPASSAKSQTRESTGRATRQKTSTDVSTPTTRQSTRSAATPSSRSSSSSVNSSSRQATRQAASSSSSSRSSVNSSSRSSSGRSEGRR